MEDAGRVSRPQGSSAVHVPGDTLAEADTPAVAAAGQPPAPSSSPKLSQLRHAAISSFWLANNLHWGALGMIIIPNQATRMAGAVRMTEGEISGWTIGLGAIVGALVP